MSHHEYNRIRLSLAPFIRLMLAIAMLGLLASCGGGGISVTDSTVNTTGDIPFNINKVVSSTPNLSIEQSTGYISNRKWVTSNTLTKSQLIEKINSFSLLKIVAYREYMNGVLIEFNDLDADSLAQVEKLKNEPLIDSVFYDSYSGKDVKHTFFVPSNGANFTDGGDNWGFENIGLMAAWDITEGISSDFTNIGVFDNGFFLNHTVLKSRVSPIRNSPEIKDHGTAVAGIIGGWSNIPNSKFGGINQQSTIFSDFIECENASFPEYYFNTVKAKNIRVINNSWGCMDSTNQNATANDGFLHTRKFRKIAQNTPNILHIWAAGNAGKQADTQNGSLHKNDAGLVDAVSNIITVGAYGVDGTLLSYSNFGSLVDIAAPTDIKAPSSDGLYYEGRVGYFYGNSSYTLDTTKGFGGTSAAAPIVTGVVSLMLSVNKDLKPIDIKNIIIQTADRFVTQRTLENGSKEILENPIPIINAEKAVRAAIETLSKPTATISIITPSPLAGSGVIFEPNITASPNGGVTEFEWDFGDGTIQMGTAGQISHTYTSGGSYTVKLKIKDVKGVTNTTTVPVTVAGVSVPAVASISPATATAGEVTTFSVAGTNLSTSRQLDITFNGCANIAVILKSVNLHKFTCTPQGAGTITVDIRATAGGAILKSQQVTVTAVQSKTTTSCTNPVTNTLFSESFTSPLNSSVWSVDTGGGTVTSTTGKISLSGSGIRFPYIQTINNPFPETGNYSFYCKANFLNSGNNGASACVAAQNVIPAGSATITYAFGTTFQWHKDSVEWYTVDASTVSSNYNIYVKNPTVTSGVHELETCVIGSTVTTYKDGIQIGTGTMPVGYIRPTRAYIGNPVNGSYGYGWPTIEVHKIEVRQLQ